MSVIVIVGMVLTALWLLGATFLALSLCQTAADPEPDAVVLTADSPDHLDWSLFAVQVVETPLGLYSTQTLPDAVREARLSIAGRYDELARVLDFASASRIARAEWLGQYVRKHAAQDVAA